MNDKYSVLLSTVISSVGVLYLCNLFICFEGINKTMLFLLVFNTQYIILKELLR